MEGKAEIEEEENEAERQEVLYTHGDIEIVEETARCVITSDGKRIRKCQECGALDSDNGVKVSTDGICNFCKMEVED